MISKHDEIREELEAYALGALEPKERARIDRHLRECHECQRTVSGYANVAELFPGALQRGSTTRLDPATKGQVLRAIAGSRRAPLLAAGLAAALVLAISLAWNLQLGRQLDQERAALGALIGYQEIVFEVLDSSQTRKALLKPAVPGSTSYGKVFVRRDLPFVVAMVGRLAGAPEGQAYHLWLTYDTGETVLAGTFRPKPNTQGFDALVYDAGRNGPLLSGAKVTLQANGSLQPEGVPILILAN
jgi:hypothetical protein